MNRRIEGKYEVKIEAERAVVYGDVHEAGGGRYGYYADGNSAADGDTIAVHTQETLVIPAPSALTLSIGGLVNFDLTTQAAVASGGVNIGRVVYAKVDGQTVVTVALNSTLEVVNTQAAVVAALTDNSGGASADGTIGAVTTFTPSVAWNGSSVYPSAADATAITAAITALKDAVKELSAKQASVLTSLKNANLMASA